MFLMFYWVSQLYQLTVRFPVFNISII